MEEQNGNKYVRWKIFAWAVGIVTLLLIVVFTVSGRALDVSHANELKINRVEITEDLHYKQVVESLGRIERNLGTKE